MVKVWNCTILKGWEWLTKRVAMNLNVSYKTNKRYLFNVLQYIMYFHHIYSHTYSSQQPPGFWSKIQIQINFSSEKLHDLFKFSQILGWSSYDSDIGQLCQVHCSLYNTTALASKVKFLCVIEKKTEPKNGGLIRISFRSTSSRTSLSH